MHNEHGRLGWISAFVIGVIWIRAISVECSAQIPDPVTLIQAVEAARLQIPPSRLQVHLVFRDSLRKSEGDFVIEFDGDSRRSIKSISQGTRQFYDGSQACQFDPISKLASFRDLSDATSDPLFDPRALGLSSCLWIETVSNLLPYKHGRVEMVGREQIRGIDAWHVRISVERANKYQIDLWIGDTERFPVYRYDMTLETERRSIISFYENQEYSWLPSKVDYSALLTNGTLRFGMTITLTKAEANVALSETNWTLAGLNLPIGTRVEDRRTKLTVGFWNGTNLTPWEVWDANRRAKRDAPVRSQHSRIIVWILLFAATVIPFLLWKGLRKGKEGNPG